MEKINPPDMSFLLLNFERKGQCYLAVSVLGGFTLTETPELIEEGDIWKAAGDELGKNDVLDAGMPKQAGEALAAGMCFAPDGKSLPAFQVKISVGSIGKTLNVFGNRYWKRAGGTIKIITDPEPFIEMPVTYENAFGGYDYKSNLTGKGLSPVTTESGETILPLPNIEDPDNLIGSPSDRPEPAGFGPLDVTNPRRAKKLGTFDEKWRRENWPYYPEDMDWSFFNTAPENQQIKEYFTGDESISIANMHPERQFIRSRLPGLRARCFVNQEKDGETHFKEVKTHLDTVWLFPGAETGVILFHGLVRVADDEAEDVLHLTGAWESLDEEPKPVEFYMESLKGETAEVSFEKKAEMPVEPELKIPGIPKVTAAGITGVAAAAAAAGAEEVSGAPTAAFPETPGTVKAAPGIPGVAVEKPEMPGAEDGATRVTGAVTPSVPGAVEKERPGVSETVGPGITEIAGAIAPEAAVLGTRGVFEKAQPIPKMIIKEVVEKPVIEEKKEKAKKKRPEKKPGVTPEKPRKAVEEPPGEIPAQPEKEEKSALDDYIDKYGDKLEAEAEKRFRELLEKAGIENPDQYFTPRPEDVAIFDDDEAIDALGDKLEAEAMQRFRELLKKAGIENPDQYFTPKPEDVAIFDDDEAIDALGEKLAKEAKQRFRELLEKAGIDPEPYLDWSFSTQGMIDALGGDVPPDVEKEIRDMEKEIKEGKKLWENDEGESKKVEG